MRKLFTMMLLLLVVGFQENSVQKPEKLYVGIVDKSFDGEFYERMVLEDGYVIIGEQNLNESFVEISVKPDKNLFVAELNSEDAVLPLELWRHKNIVLTAIPQWAIDPHAFYGRHDFYAKPLQWHPQRAKQTAGADLIVSQRGMFQPVDVDPIFLQQKLEELSGARSFEIDGMSYSISERSSRQGRSLARMWMRNQFEALGYSVREHEYRSGANFIAERSGAQADKYLIVGAHYDSVGNAGADDDATGIVMALAVAKYFAEQDLEIGLRFMGFDEEELGLVGSKYYARSLSSVERQNVVGVLAMEMSGYDQDNDGAIHVIHCNEGRSSTLAGVFGQVVTRDPLGLQIVRACTNRSDHASFWDVGIPAVVVSQNFFGGDSNPCYHRSCDSVANINYDYMTKITKMLAMGVGDIVLR